MGHLDPLKDGHRRPITWRSESDIQFMPSAGMQPQRKLHRTGHCRGLGETAGSRQTARRVGRSASDPGGRATAAPGCSRKAARGSAISTPRHRGRGNVALTYYMNSVK
jgi:hypothetical protein